MNRTIVFIGIIAISTFFAMILSSGATSYLYNKNWLANENEIPECLLYSPVTIDCAEKTEYLNGLFWWSNIISFSILIAGVASCIILWKKRTVVRRS